MLLSIQEIVRNGINSLEFIKFVLKYLLLSNIFIYYVLILVIHWNLSIEHHFISLINILIHLLSTNQINSLKKDCEY